MPSMYARLRDEAQVEIDAWLAQGGGLKTIVSITHSESMEKTVDANFHLSITIVYDEVWDTEWDKSNDMHGMAYV